jgi:hypothetical protein
MQSIHTRPEEFMDYGDILRPVRIISDKRPMSNKNPLTSLILMELEDVRRYLRTLSRKSIRFNEPHFSTRLVLRDGRREEVINLIMQADRLVDVKVQQGKYGDTIYVLFFMVTRTRTMILPAIISKQGLYILTYIDRHRGMHNG